MALDVERAADELLRCPVGCAFLALIDDNDLTIEAAVSPRRALVAAAEAVRYLGPWDATRDYKVERALTFGAGLRDLARELLSHPGAEWWSAPFEGASQVRIGHGMSHVPQAEEGPHPNHSDNAQFETYAQRPSAGQLTSTAHGGVSSLDATLAIAPGDWSGTDPRSAPVELIEGARVLELSSPDDWHALCVEHASAARTISGGAAGAGTIVPNWRSVEREWDGIHLTFLGLLTTLFVRTQTTEGASMLWTWDAAGTMWLRPELLAASRTPEPGNTEGGADAVGLPSLDNHHLRWPPAPFDPDAASRVLLQPRGSSVPLEAGDRERLLEHREEILRRSGYLPQRRWRIWLFRFVRWWRRR